VTLRSLPSSGLLFWLTACSAAEAEDPERTYIPVPRCEAFEYAPCDTLQTECQRARLALAACLRGSEPGELPPVMLVTEVEYAAALQAQIAAETPRPNPDHWERALSLLGLVETGAFQPSSVIMDQVKQIAGFYDFELQAITLIDHGSPATDARSNMVLLHELVHALQDREENLASYSEAHIVSYDSYWAVASVSEGEAELHAHRYAASLSGLDPARIDWRDRFERRIAKGDTWTLQQPSPLLATRSAFPYHYGERLADFAWQAGGHEAVRALFADPPESTWVLMASTDERREPPTVVEPTPPAPPEGWMLDDYEVLGAWGVILALRESAEPFRGAALGWRGDSLAVYSGGSTTSETALVWQIEFTDDASATAIAGRLAVSVRGLRVERNAARVTIAGATAPVSLDWAFVEP